VFWTAFGEGALSELPECDSAGRVVILLWLGGWIVGECVVAVVVAPPFFGSDRMTVTTDALEVGQTLAGLTRTRRHDAALVRAVSPMQLPTSDEEMPRDDFCLQLSYGGETIPVGEDMSESEVEHVAEIVLSRVRRSDSGEVVSAERQ